MFKRVYNLPCLSLAVAWFQVPVPMILDLDPGRVMLIETLAVTHTVHIAVLFVYYRAVAHEWVRSCVGSNVEACQKCRSRCAGRSARLLDITRMRVKTYPRIFDFRVSRNKLMRRHVLLLAPKTLKSLQYQEPSVAQIRVCWGGSGSHGGYKGLQGAGGPGRSAPWQGQAS